MFLKRRIVRMVKSGMSTLKVSRVVKRFQEFHKYMFQELLHSTITRLWQVFKRKTTTCFKCIWHRVNATFGLHLHNRQYLALAETTAVTVQKQPKRPDTERFIHICTILDMSQIWHTVNCILILSGLIQIWHYPKC